MSTNEPTEIFSPAPSTNPDLREMLRDVLNEIIAPRLDSIELQLTALNVKVATLDERVAKLDERVARLEEQVAKLEERMTAIEDRQSTIEEEIRGQRRDFLALKEEVKDLRTDFRHHQRDLIKRLVDIEDRLDVLENPAA